MKGVGSSKLTVIGSMRTAVHYMHLRHLVHRAGIFKKSMGTRHRVGIGLSYRPARLHRLAESIPGLHNRLKIRALYTANESPHPSRILLTSPKRRHIFVTPWKYPMTGVLF
jgi:hypothetical protein